MFKQTLQEHLAGSK